NSPADVPIESTPIPPENETLRTSATDELALSSSPPLDRPEEACSECERSHLMARLCAGCGREFISKRRWQRGCCRPAWRVAASRRRRAAELRTELELIAKALDREEVQGARASLADLVSKLGTRQSR